ncbi:MAG: ComEA family DNA-binding protein [Bacillota bacterium]
MILKREDLTSIKGIGASTADRILKESTEIYNFEELKQVKGIGSSIFTRIKNYYDLYEVSFNPTNYNITEEINNLFIVGDQNNWNVNDSRYSLIKNYQKWTGCFNLAEGCEYKLLYNSNSWQEGKHIGQKGLQSAVNFVVRG